MNEIDDLIEMGSPYVDAYLDAPSGEEPVGYPEEVWESGSRVAFSPTLEASLTYADPPEPGELGTVISVRTGSGDRTSYAGQVFVSWDSGAFLPVFQEHVAASGHRTASNFRRAFADLGDLGDFMKVAGAEGDLVHRATRDLWSLKEVKGQYVIERLFDDTGRPLKV